MWIERLQWQESELKTQRSQFSRSSMIWETLKRWDWQPQRLKHHWRRSWTPSNIVWAILLVSTMGSMGMTRMMFKYILCWASWAKMTNLAGWWAQSPQQYSIACSIFSRHRWSLTNWCNQAAEMWPTTFVSEMISIWRPNRRFRLSFKLKQKMMQHRLQQQHSVILRRHLIVSPEPCKYCKWHLDQGVVIWGYPHGNLSKIYSFHLSRPTQCPICQQSINRSLLNRSAFTLNSAS